MLQNLPSEILAYTYFTIHSVQLKNAVFFQHWVRLFCYEVLVWNGLGTGSPICFSSGLNPATCWWVGWAGTQLLPLCVILGHGKYCTVSTSSMSACPPARSSPLDLCNYIPVLNFTCSAELCCLKADTELERDTSLFVKKAWLCFHGAGVLSVTGLWTR